MRKTADTHHQGDVTLAKLEHGSVLNAATQKTVASDRPRLGGTIVFVIPNCKTLYDKQPKTCVQCPSNICVIVSL